MTQLHWWMTVCAVYAVFCTPVAADESCPSKATPAPAANCCADGQCCTAKNANSHVMLKITALEVDMPYVRLLEWASSYPKKCESKTDALTAVALSAEQRSRVENVITLLRLGEMARILASPTLVTCDNQEA